MSMLYPMPGKGSEGDKGAFIPHAEEVTGAVGKAWMITFSDLISLMLTFFVMLFAMSNVKLDEWSEITDTLSRSLDPKPVEQDVPVAATFNIDTIVFEKGARLEYLAGVLQEALEQDDVLSRSLMVEHDDRIVISVPDDVLFADGDATIDQTAEEAIFELSSIFRNIDNKIILEGHAGADAGTGAFASNWELSIARAAAVADVMRRSGVQQTIGVIGYADSRYSALIAQNLSDERLRALTDRVDIVVHPGVAATDP